MKSALATLLISLCAVLGLAGPVLAGKAGKANLLVRQQTTKTTEPTVEVGQVLTVEAFVEGQGEAVTQVSVILSFDDTYLEIIPVGQQGGTIRPFTSGGWLAGQVFSNDTLGDQIGNSQVNQIPLFQLNYSELIPRFQGAPQRVAGGDGVAARFSLRVIRKPPNGVTSLVVNVRSPTGGETGYFISSDPGSVYNFRRITTMKVTVQGLDLDVQLPDLFLLPGQIDTSLDLDEFIEDPSTPDADISWQASIPDPDSISVSIDNITHVVTVNSQSFIGIAGVRFTASTQFGEDVTDSIRVIVDTPPLFDEAAIPDTIQFLEDGRDSSLVLVAIDPDPGEVLTFSSPDSDTKTFAFIDQNQRVTFTAEPNYFGTETRVFVVEDRFTLTDTVQVVVIVTSVNDPPEYIQAFPDIEIGILGQETLDLPDFVRDVDDLFEALQFSFSGADSIAFDVSPDNRRISITAVPPFMGTRMVDVVARDPSGGTDVQSIRVSVMPLEEPQAPEVIEPYGSQGLKIGVSAGAGVSTVALDTLVNDLDTPKQLLNWSATPVSLVQLIGSALTNRQLQVGSAPDSVGFRQTTLTVTDPTALFDTLSVRIYSASPVTGIPVAGGLPDLIILANTTSTLDLDDYYFDANNTDSDMTWTASGQVGVSVSINTSTHSTVFTAPAVGNGVEEIVFTVADPAGNAANDTMRVIVLNPGSVLLDTGGSVTVEQGGRDTIDLVQFIQVGDPNSVRWDANSVDPTVVFAFPTTREVVLVGLQEGNTFVEITATDTVSGRSDTDSLRVFVVPQGGAGTLQVVDQIAITLTADQDTTIDLNSFLISGNSQNLDWSSNGNQNVGVEIDQQNAILRPIAGFFGNAGAIVFQVQVQDRVTGDERVTLASPVQVVGGSGAAPGGLLEISLVANPVRKNFLDVFVISRRELLSDPFLVVQVGDDPDTKPAPVTVNEVAGVEGMWVGDVVLGDDVIGSVEISATGITETTRIALTDTVRLEIQEAGIQSGFVISNRSLTVALPSGALAKPSIIAIIPQRRRTDSRSPGVEVVHGALQPASEVYWVHATEGDIRGEGEIRFNSALAGRDHLGVYHWDEDFGQWRFVGKGTTGTFPAFGRYGLFLDEVSPIPAEPEVIASRGVLAIPVEETGSGIDSRSIHLTVDGRQVEASYGAEEGTVVWAPDETFDPGDRVLRLELTDLAGNAAVMEREIDLTHLIPIPSEYALHQNFPNPFNPATTIGFEIPERTMVRLTVYNMLGQEVRRLLSEPMKPGQYAISWDARDAVQRSVAGGIYFYRLETEGAVMTMKMLLLK